MKLWKCIDYLKSGKSICNPLLSNEPIKMDKSGYLHQYMFIDGELFGTSKLSLNVLLLESDKWELWQGFK